jgi:hypothetical protein
MIDLFVLPNDPINSITPITTINPTNASPNQPPIEDYDLVETYSKGEVGITRFSKITSGETYLSDKTSLCTSEEHDLEAIELLAGMWGILISTLNFNQNDIPELLGMITSLAAKYNKVRTLPKFLPPELNRKQRIVKLEDSELDFSVYVIRPRKNIPGFVDFIDGTRVQKGAKTIAASIPQIDKLLPDVINNDIHQELNLGLKNQYVTLLREIIEQDPDIKHVLIDTPFKSIVGTKEKGRSLRTNNGTGMPSLYELTRDEFLALAETPEEFIHRLVAGLDQRKPGSKEISELLELALKNNNQREKQAAKKLLYNFAFKMLKQEVGVLFDGPEISRVRINHQPERLRTYPTQSIEKRAARTLHEVDNPGFFLVHKTLETGEISVKSLSQVLNHDGKIDDPSDLEAVLSSDSIYRDAQILYLLIKTLDEPNSDLFDSKKILSRKELIDLIRKYQVEFKNFTNFEETPIQANKISRGHKIRNSILSALITFGSIQGVHFFLNSAKSLSEQRGVLIKNRIHEIDTFKVGFSEKPPESVPEWGLESKGLSPQGYFVTSTSAKFANGQWKNTTEPKYENINFPKTVQPNTPTLEVEKFVLIGNDEITLKIPVRNGTTIGAINITGPNGKEIPYLADMLIDNTVNVKIDPGMIGNSANLPLQALRIKASLVEATDRKPQATKPLPELDISQIDNGALNSIKPFFENRPFGYLDYATELKQAKMYSINPGEEVISNLNQVETPEDFINFFAETDSCECDVCNTGLVLASTLNQESKDLPALNYAIGFINTDSGVLVTSNFLMSGGRHGFAITESGEIVDGTPHTIAQDEDTQRYLNNTQANSETKILTAKQAWENQIKSMLEQQNEAEQNKEKTDLQLRILGLALASLGSIYTYAKAKVFLTSKLRQKNEQTDPNLAEKVFLRIKEQTSTPNISSKEQSRIASFLTRISYGLNATSGNSMPEFENKHQFLNFLRNNVSIDKLLFYLGNGSIEVDGKPFENKQMLNKMKAIETDYVFTKKELLAIKSITEYLANGN